MKMTSGKILLSIFVLILSILWIQLLASQTNISKCIPSIEASLLVDLIIYKS